MARSTASLRSSTMAPPFVDVGTRVFGVPSLQTRRGVGLSLAVASGARLRASQGRGGRRPGFGRRRRERREVPAAHRAAGQGQTDAPRVFLVADFVEVSDRVWVARYDWFDVNVGLVAGSAGLLVIDTNATPALGRDALDA